VFRGPGRMWPTRKWDREGCSHRGQETTCRPSEMACWTRTMIASAFDPKPGDIPLIFWDRIKACDAVSAKHGRLASKPKGSLARCVRQTIAGATTPDLARAQSSRGARAWIVRGSQGPTGCGRKRSFRRYGRPGSGARCHHPSARWRLGRRSLGHRTTRIMRDRQAGLA